MRVFASYVYSIFSVVCILNLVNGTERAVQSNPPNEKDQFREPKPESNHIEATELSITTTNLCSNGKGFKSLDECKETCNFRGTGDSVHKVNYQLRPSYKLLTLNYNEYYIEDEKLIATRPALETFDYIVRNDTALVCYKLPSSFVECMHRCVDKDNLTLTEDETRLYVMDYKRWYPFDEFYMINEPNRCIGAAVCISEITLIFQKLEDIHLILDIMSAVFLWITFTLCFILPSMDVRQNRPLLYHLAMLAVGYTVICWKSAAMMYFSDFLTDAWCISLSSIQQFTLLSAFFWMSVQYYELYSSLRQPLWPDILQCLDKKRWVVHWLCGWILPLVLTVLALGSEIFVSFPGQLTPGFAQECWFSFNNKATLFIWYYGWMAFSLAINLLLFIFIMKSLRKWSKDTEMVNNRSLMQTFIILGKLMFIMGFCWVVNLLRWSLLSRGYVYYALDMVRALQGVYIFVAYVCRRRVWLNISRSCKGKKKEENLDTEL